VSYFGGYQAAMHDEYLHVHIFRDDDRETFCGLTDARYGTVREVVRAHKGCEECFKLAQEVRRDV
jgi:hypothetical protein